MNHRDVLTGHGLKVALLCVLASSGCGGRAVTVEGAGGSAASASGGTSVAGAGARGGSTAQGGSGAQAGGANCDAVCLSVGCGPNETLVTPPGACCPVCMPIGCPPCPQPPCGAGYHLENPDGQCCSVCVPDEMTSACQAQQMNYAALSSQITEKYRSLPCMTDADCTVVGLISPCNDVCEQFAVLRSVSDSMVSLLSQAATDSCGACPPPSVISCGDLSSPHCYSGRCEIEILPK